MRWTKGVASFYTFKEMENLYEALLALPIVDWYLTGYVTVVTPNGDTDIIRQDYNVYTIDNRGYTLNEIMSFFDGQTILEVNIRR